MEAAHRRSLEPCRWHRLILKAMIAMYAVLLFAFAVPARADVPAQATWALPMPEAPARFHVGDDPAWADPGFDDSAWEPAVMGRPWRRWSTAGVDAPRGWYRVRVPVPPDYPLSVFNENIAAAFEIYVNGQLLGSRGDIEQGEVDGEGLVSFEVPRELTRDGELLIATRVAYRGMSRGGGFIEPWGYGHPQAVLQLPTQRILQFSGFGVTWSLVGAGLIGLGGLHGLLWVRRQEPTQGFFAIGATLLGLWLVQTGLTNLRLMPRHELLDSTFVLRQVVAYVSLLWFVHYFVGSKSYRVVWVATSVVLASTLLRQVLPPWAAGPLWAISYTLMALILIVLIGVGLRRRKPYMRFLTAGFLPVALFVVVEAAALLLSYVGLPTFSFAEYRASIILFGFASVLGTMSFALISRFADTLDEIERTWRATARFVPAQFLALLGRRRITEVQRGDSASRDITVMFCAIPGFSDTTQGWTAEQSFAFLNRFLAAMEPHIHENGGFVAQYLGDGFLAMFPVGSSHPVDAAVALQEAARALEPEPGAPRVKVAIGLHTGPVMLGTVGSEERLTTGQVSDVVNTSSRVKGLTAHYGAPIVISEATRALVSDEGWALQELDAVIMKGKVEPLRAFEVLGGEPDLILRRYKESEASVYGEGLAAFRAGELERARRLFSRLAERWVAARLFVQRCDWFLTHGLPDDWDGVVRLSVK